MTPAAPTASQGLDPRLIVLPITGFGPDGPEASRAGYDQILHGEVKPLDRVDDPPPTLGQPNETIREWLQR
jgi:hypothetical protein